MSPRSRFFALLLLLVLLAVVTIAVSIYGRRTGELVVEKAGAEATLFRREQPLAAKPKPEPQTEPVEPSLKLGDVKLPARDEEVGVGSKRIIADGKIRLRPGESGVMTYWGVEAGMNGVLFFTAEVTSDGFHAVTFQREKLSDQAVADEALDTLFPDIFGGERTAALSSDQREAFAESIRNQKEAGQTSQTFPRMVTLPGESVRFLSAVSEPDGTSIAHQSFFAELNRLPDGGFDVSFEYDELVPPE